MKLCRIHSLVAVLLLAATASVAVTNAVPKLAATRANVAHIDTANFHRINGVWHAASATRRVTLLR